MHCLSKTFLMKVENKEGVAEWLKALDCKFSGRPTWVRIPPPLYVKWSSNKAYVLILFDLNLRGYAFSGELRLLCAFIAWGFLLKARREISVETRSDRIVANTSGCKPENSGSIPLPT